MAKLQVGYDDKFSMDSKINKNDNLLNLFFKKGLCTASYVTKSDNLVRKNPQHFMPNNPGIKRGVAATPLFQKTV